MDKKKLKQGTRVALDMTTLTIMRFSVLLYVTVPALEIASSNFFNRQSFLAVLLHFQRRCKPSVSATYFRYLPREVDPLVYNMSHEDPGNISYSEVGGLSEQIRELREVCIFSMSSFTRLDIYSAVTSCQASNH